MFRRHGKHHGYRLHKGARSGAERTELWRSFVKQLRPRRTLRAGRAALPAYVFHYATILASTPLASQAGAATWTFCMGRAVGAYPAAAF